MKRLIGFASAHSRPILIGLMIVTLLAATQVPRLEVRIPFDSLAVEEERADESGESTSPAFATAEILVVFLRDVDLFNPTTLAAIRLVVERLDGLPFVEGTDSLFSIQHGRLGDNEEVDFSPFLDPLPATEDALESVKRAALANAFVAGNLLSDDGRSMAINVRLKPHYASTISDQDVVKEINTVLSPLSDVLGEVFAVGQPYLNATIATHIVRDQMVILPLALAVLLLSLLVSLGHWQGALLPFLTAVTSLIWTSAFMVIVGIPLNVLTAVVPLLLVVVGSTEDIHLLAAYFSRRHEGAAPMPAIEAMAAATGLAVLLTFATTYLGFLSIMLNDIGLLRDFGLVASTGLMFNFLITSLLVPAVLGLDTAARSAPSCTTADRYQRVAESLFSFASRHRNLIIAIAMALVVTAVAGALKLRVDANVSEYLPDDSPIAGQTERLHQQLAGLHTFSIEISSGIKGTFEQVRYLAEVERLQAFVSGIKNVDKTLSFVDVVKEIDRIMQGAPPGELLLPPDDALVREYLLFADGSLLHPFVNDDFSRTRIVVRHDIDSSREFAQLHADIDAFASDNTDIGLDVRLRGPSVDALRAAEALALGQAESLALVMLAIFVIVATVFVNLKAGLLAVVPNILPVAVLFGVMGFFGIPLSAGTAMVAAIAIGICVDNTIHFLMRYHQEMRTRPSAEQAIRATMREEARPIMSTALALTLGFSILTLSSFPPVAHFGVLAALVFVLALLATFLIAPLLLNAVRLVTVWDVLGVQVKARLMSDCALFEGMRRFQVRKLIAMSSCKTFEAGDLVVREGDASHELFVILTGKVKVQRQSQGPKPEILNTMGVGDVFGEIALTTKGVRTADVIAIERAELLTLRWDDLLALNRWMPRTASRLVLNIANRMGQRMISRHF